MGKINEFGDDLVLTHEGYGNDISANRIDDLDQSCLDCAARLYKSNETEQVRFLDLGGGTGGQSKRLATAGATVTFVDLSDQKEAIAQFNQTHTCPPIKFICQDMRQFSGGPFDIIYSQRAIQYLRYNEAKILLTKLFASSPGAYVFISAVGIEADDRIGYPDIDKPIEDRFACLRPELAQKIHATQPLALYSKSDLGQLLQESGATNLELWLSSSGNVKAKGQIPPRQATPTA